MYYLEYTISYEDRDIDNYPETRVMVEEVICDPKEGEGRTRQEVIDIILKDVLEVHGTAELMDLFNLTHPSYYRYKKMCLTIDNRFCDEFIKLEDIQAQPAYKRELKRLKTLYKSQQATEKRRKRKSKLIRDNEMLRRVVKRFKSVEEIKVQIKKNTEELKTLEVK